MSRIDNRLPVDMLRGQPVLVMRQGHYPNRNDITDVMSTHPNAIVRTEVMHYPHTRFVVTAQTRH